MYEITVSSDSSHMRSYSTDCTDVLAWARKNGRAETGEVIYLYGETCTDANYLDRCYWDNRFCTYRRF